MASYRITCVVKPNRTSTHEHITHLGNTQQGWMMTREKVIQYIDDGTHSFYTEDSAGHRAAILVVRESGKQPYLRTAANGAWTDNLLSLEDCGASCRLI